MKSLAVTQRFDVKRNLALVFLVAMLLVAIAVSGYGNSPAANAGKSVAERMKTIGIIGGVSWQSSIEYYRQINDLVGKRLGGLHSGKILMYSIEFGDFSKQERLASQGNWAPLRKTMIDAAQRLKREGADFIVIASNTMNSTADLIEAKVKIPVLHIADATGQKVALK